MEQPTEPWRQIRRISCAYHRGRRTEPSQPPRTLDDDDDDDAVQVRPNVLLLHESLVVLGRAPARGGPPYIQGRLFLAPSWRRMELGLEPFVVCTRPGRWAGPSVNHPPRPRLGSSCQGDERAAARRFGRAHRPQQPNLEFQRPTRVLPLTRWGGEFTCDTMPTNSVPVRRFVNSRRGHVRLSSFEKGGRFFVLFHSSRNGRRTNTKDRTLTARPSSPISWTRG